MAPQSCLRLLRKISGFTNCPHPYRDDRKGGCVEKASGDLGCEWPQEDCGPECCQIPIQLILIITVIILTPPFLRSRAGSEKDNDRVDSVEDGKVPNRSSSNGNLVRN